jgi:hypothetical protein
MGVIYLHDCLISDTFSNQLKIDNPDDLVVGLLQVISNCLELRFHIF